MRQILHRFDIAERKVHVKLNAKITKVKHKYNSRNDRRSKSSTQKQ